MSKSVVSQSVSSEVSVDDVVVNSVLSFLQSHGVGVRGKKVNSGSEWSGTMSDLRSELVKVVGRKAITTLPGSPSALRTVLNRVLNRIRCRGVTVKFTRATTSDRTRLVTFVG